jgi:hypothetical protein
MTLKIGWLHEAENSRGTWLHQADDWHTYDLQRMKLTSYYCSTPRRPRRDSLSNWTQSSESHGAREASSAKRSEPARRK